MALSYTANNSKFNYEFKSPAGMVAKDLRRRGRELVKLARAQVGKDSGVLMRSIGYSLETGPNGLYIRVGSNNRHALMHHNGTRPHIIRPRRPNGMLRFSQGGVIVHRKLVHHPGTRPNPYLVDNLRPVVMH
jgi:hypothetical protein